MQEDEEFRSDWLYAIYELYQDADTNDNGRLGEREAYPFFDEVRSHLIKEGFVVGNTDKDFKTNQYRAYNSLSPDREGFTFSDVVIATRVVYNYQQSTRFLIERLHQSKEITDRPAEVVVMKTCGISKQDYQNFQALAKAVEKSNEQPDDAENIEPGPCPQEAKEKIEEKYWESYDRHIKKQLEPEARKRVQDEVEAQVRQIEAESMRKAKQRIENAKAPRVARKMTKEEQMEIYYREKERRAAEKAMQEKLEREGIAMPGDGAQARVKRVIETEEEKELKRQSEMFNPKTMVVKRKVLPGSLG